MKNGQRVQRLKSELANCRQKGLAIEAYYGKLTQLWRSIADYQRAKTMEEVRKEREEDKRHQFLMGLDDTLYGAVKSALLSSVPLRTLEEAYNALTQDEESMLLGRLVDERPNTMSFAVQANSSLYHNSENRGSCSVCGRQGHGSENCLRRIGYPSWWPDKTRNKTGNNSQKNNSSSNAAGRGNQTVVVGSSKSKPSDFAQAHHVLTSNTNSSSLTSADRVGLTGLNDGEWKLLQAMLEERKRTSTT